MMQLTKSSNSQNETDNKQSVCGHEIIFVLVAIPFQVVGAEGQLSPILSQSGQGGVPWSKEKDISLLRQLMEKRLD